MPIYYLLSFILIYSIATYLVSNVSKCVTLLFLILRMEYETVCKMITQLQNLVKNDFINYENTPSNMHIDFTNFHRVSSWRRFVDLPFRNKDTEESIEIQYSCALKFFHNPIITTAVGPIYTCVQKGVSTELVKRWMQFQASLASNLRYRWELLRRTIS